MKERSLSSERKRLLERVLAERGVARGGHADLEPRSDAGPAVLSFGQERLWFLDRMQPNSSVYNEHWQARLTGPLDAAALQGALNAVVDRHEVLRTTFSTHDEQPVQVIADSLTLEVPLIDVSGTEEARRSERAEEAARAVVSEPFDLERGPLLRAAVVKVDRDEHLFVLCIHHIAADGWSLSVLGRELGELYSAQVTGRAPRLEPLEVQYADYALWQRRRLQGPELERELAYWVDKLDGAPTVLELPTDRARPAVQSFAGGTETFTIDAALTERVVELARATDTTPFMVLLAAFYVLLQRYSGQHDVVVGTPIAGRNRAQIEDLIGFFVNTLPLRCDLSGDPTFAELLARVRDTALGAYAHQDVPFEKLVEELRPDRDLRITPVFQVTFSLQSPDSGAIEMGELDLQFDYLEHTTAKFDLSVDLTMSDGAIAGVMNFNSDLFDRATIADLTRHFVNLVETATVRPDHHIARMEMVDEAERRRLLLDHNQTESSFETTPVHVRISECAKRTPDAVAIETEDESITFAELERRAAVLQRRLHEVSFGRGDVAGTLLPRGIDLVVAQLAILRAGGAYVPIDPGYPDERVASMLGSSGASILVSERDSERRSPGIPVLHVDDDDPIYEPDTDDIALVGTDDPAAVIFTSGSTGTANGAILTHGSLANFASWHQRAYSIGSLDRASLLAHVSFDASAWETWANLSAGASLVVAPDEVRLDPARLVRWLNEAGVTISFLPTILADRALQEPWPRAVGLRWLLTGGEQLARRPAEDFPTHLVNHYGPAETTVVATAGPVDAGASAISIGTPIDNVRCYLLDGELEPVPYGVVGEIYVGGTGVGGGYVGRPGPTAERFLPDPFARHPGAVMYRTGDLARRSRDGSLFFVGRADDQVKVRGFRVELGEVEACLAAVPGVAEVVATVRARGQDANLVAYFVPDSDGTPDPRDVRARAARTLPPHMVPSAIVAVDAIPRTLTGKLDRRSLPDPEATRTRDEHRPPGTPSERAVAAIWEEVLEVSDVGLDDNFFELGGHSLMGAQVISRIRSTLGVELPIRTLFEQPTVAGLAAAVAVASPSAPRPIARLEETESPLSFAQQRLWFLDQMEPASSTYNIPAAIWLKGDLDVGALEQAFNLVTERHEILRSRFPAVGGEPRQVVAPAMPVPVRFVDLSSEDPRQAMEQAREIARDEGARPFDLFTGPLLRVSLIRASTHMHLLVVCVHHIVFDGWSLGVFTDELSRAYRAFASDLEPDLPALEIQYADFARWQRDWLSGGELERQLEYWRGALAEAPPPLEVAGDRPRPPIRMAEGRTRSFSLGSDVSDRITRLARELDATPFMVGLAAFNVLLARYTGRDDIVVGCPVANRNRAEIENLIGFFVNTLVVRTDLSGDPSFAELVERVKQVALEVFAHQDVPFEKLVDELNPPRDLSVTPLFQVAFGVQSTSGVELDLPDIETELEAIEDASAKYDLSVDLFEMPEGFVAEFNYSTALYDEATIVTLADHLVRVLDAVVTDPERHLSEVDLLTDEERRKILVEFNQDVLDFDENALIHELFEGAASEHGDAPALLFEDDVVTYRSLNERANRIAHYLRERGIGVEDLVAVALDRSVDLYAAILGVLKAGAAYVPIDPGYPPGRMAVMLESSGARCVLTTKSVAPRLPDGPWDEIALDVEADAIASLPSENLPRSARPRNLAYVIFTSGSTGRPKGVLLEHRGFANLVAAQRRDFEVGPGDRVLQFASIGFDGSLWELGLAWGAGAALCVGSRATTLPGTDLWQFMRDLSVSVAAMPASALAAVPSTGLPALRTVMIAGEALPGELAARWASEHKVFNGYGPTEATVATSWQEVTSVSPSDPAPPIGRPIPNFRVYLLDERLRPVPVGVTGHLHIAGAGLARGYLGHPDRTAERFLPDPFGPTPGDRMYATGDLARFRRDGSLEFVGRIDRQVKVRGFRIELGEIEAALVSHQQIEGAVVLAREDVPGDRRLAAYLVAAGEAPSVAELRSHLARTLPEHMVPGTFTFLSGFPLSTHGKIDHFALPPPPMDRPDIGETYAPPRNDIERTLASIWADVLRVEKVGIFDNFFALGGDSLLLMKVAARANEAGIGLSPKDMFQAQTIYDLPHVLSGTAHLETEQGEITGPVPLTPIQRWFLDLRSPEPSHFNLSISFDAEPDTDPDVMMQVIERVVWQHDALRLRLTNTDGGWQQSIAAHDPDTIHFEHVDLSSVEDKDIDKAYLDEATRVQRSFDLENGPTFRAALFDYGARRSPTLLLVAHHLCVDWVSWPVIIEDIQDLYRQIVLGEEPKLPPKTTSYKWWAQRLADYSDSPALQNELDYWLDALPADVPPLPTDRHAGDNHFGAARTFQTHIDPSTTEQVLTELPSAFGTEIMDVLVTGLTAAMTGWTGHPGLLLTMERHGREGPFDGANLWASVGWFTTLYPVYVSPPSSDVEDSLRRTRATLAAVPDNGFGFGVLRYMSPVRDRLQRLPAPQVGLNYFGQVEATYDTDGRFRPNYGEVGQTASARTPRPHLIDVGVTVAPEGMVSQWTYSTNHFLEATIERLAGSFNDAIRAMVKESSRRSQLG